VSEPLIVMTAPEVERMIVKAVSAAMGGRVDADEKPLTPKEFAKLLRVDDDRVQKWCREGMPYIPTGDERGKRIYHSKAQAWLEKNHD
jgi:hypothetical protein